MSMKREFWQGKRVLVTGHTGFTGSWMSLMLDTLGAIVCGYSLPLGPYSFYSKAEISIAEHHEGDIADREKVERALEGFRPEIIIHLASHSSLDGSDRIPDFILRTNIMGVVNLLDIARKMDCIKSIVIVTSDKCYKNLESQIPYTEDCALGGEDPYSVSKVCQELITGCYQKTFFERDNQGKNKINIATARASNVIGTGDYNLTRLIPYMLDCFKKGNTALLRNPAAIRAWQYVLDVVWGYLLLAQKLYETDHGRENYNGAYNFGPDEDGFQKVETIAGTLSACFSNAKYIFGDVERSVKGETRILKLNSTKAKTLLGWHTIYPVWEMLQEIASFVKKEERGMKTGVLCREAIQAYLKRVDRNDRM